MLWLPRKLPRLLPSSWWLRVTLLRVGWLRAWRGRAATSRAISSAPGVGRETAGPAQGSGSQALPCGCTLESTERKRDPQLEREPTTSTAAGNPASVAGGTEPQQPGQSVRSCNHGARWRSCDLWARPHRLVPARCGLGGQDSQGHEARRSSSRTADQVRTGGELEDRESARDHDPAIGPASGRQGSRVVNADDRLPELVMTASGQIQSLL